MARKIRVSAMCLLAGAAWVMSGSGCAKSSTTVTTTTTTTSTGSSGGSTVYGTTMLFTPQQFAAALSASGTAPQIPGFVTTSYAGSTLLKAPDLQGPNNVVIYDATYGGHDYAINLGVFVGMSLQQAVSAYIELQNDTSPAAMNQIANGQAPSIVLPNGQTFSLWVPPDAEPAVGGEVESTGSSGGYVASEQAPGFGYVQGTVNVVTPTGNYDAAGNPIFQDPIGNLYSNPTATRDTDLQQATLQGNAINQHAQQLVDEFQMNADSAHQLAVLSDKMNQLTANGQSMTDEDRASLSDAAFAVAGVSGDEVNAAAAKLIQTGDQSDVDALIAKAATNLGMSSAAGLKDKILPSLGINLP